MSNHSPVNIPVVNALVIVDDDDDVGNLKHGRVIIKLYNM